MQKWVKEMYNQNMNKCRCVDKFIYNIEDFLYENNNEYIT